MNATAFDLAAEPMPLVARSLLKLLSKLRHGRLCLTTPGGRQLVFTGAGPGPEASLAIRDWKAVGLMLRRSEIGVAEAWRDGLVATTDMTAFLKLCVANQAAFEAVFYGHPLMAFALRVAHVLRPNTRAGSKRNIHAHYDLGNAFYRLWLDPSMTYSSAIFHHPGQDLAEAQAAKYERLLATLGAEASHHVLEIGCGWGGFAEYAARTRGCRVTGITISKAQLAHATQRIRGAGLEDRVTLRFCDYRDLTGQFDRIVSIEMFEAVGERFWPGYFRTVRDRLAPGGRAAIQTITIAEEAFEQYRRTSDFIREYIFPGGMLPSIPRFTALARAEGLAVGEPFLFGRDYSETLRRWGRAIAEHEPQVRALGFDDAFLAIWRFYLHYCEAGFDTGRVDVMQVELRRP